MVQHKMLCSPCCAVLRINSFGTSSAQSKPSLTLGDNIYLLLLDIIRFLAVR